jgi:hypothetical protein
MCTALTHITVAADNPNYFSDAKGVLFNRDKTILISYPRGKADKTYEIPDSVTEIGRDAFGYCASLETIEIPGSVTTIGALAFQYCVSLETMKIPDSVTTIGNIAFDNCTSLTSVILSDSLTSIGLALFRNTKLESVTIPGSVASIGGRAFHKCASLTSVTILEGVTSIASNAFDGCTDLTEVTIPSSVTSIGEDAFARGGLVKITIPASVTDFGNGIFFNSPQLAEVTFLRNGDMNTFGPAAYVFYGNDSSLKIWCYDANTAVKSYAQNNSLTTVIMIESIALDQLAFNLANNGTQQLTATSTPASATGPSTLEPMTVTWKSSNPNLVSVDANGLVTADREGFGTALITATFEAHSGVTLTASASVTVAPTDTPPTYALTVNNGTVVGSGPFAENATVTIIANDPPVGQVFAGWTGGAVIIDDPSNPITFFKMPGAAATVTATYQSVYNVIVENGTSAAGSYAAGDTVTITAADALSGQVFDKWTTTDGVIFADASSVETAFTMPAKAITVTAKYKDAPAPPTPPAPTTYTVTVAGGSGSGSFEESASVSISANAPEGGKVFDTWTSSDVSFANASSATTSFTMPAKAVTVTANYKDDPNSGGDNPDNPDGPDNPPVADNGWVKNEDGKWEYLTDGEAETGWLYDTNYKSWFYLGTNGTMETGWEYDDDAWYYLAGNGAMKTSWVKDEGTWYYLRGDGKMVVSKWFKDTDGSWYYLSGNGKMLTGKRNIGTKTYTFKLNGVWIG